MKDYTLREYAERHSLTYRTFGTNLKKENFQMPIRMNLGI